MEVEMKRFSENKKNGLETKSLGRRKEMKILKTLGNKLAQHKNEAAMALAGVGVSPVMAFATSPASKKDPATTVRSIADVLVKIFPLIGIFFVLVGAFKWVMAYRQDNPEAQAGAVKDLVVGVVFLVFDAFIWVALKAIV